MTRKKLSNINLYTQARAFRLRNLMTQKFKADYCDSSSFDTALLKGSQQARNLLPRF